MFKLMVRQDMVYIDDEEYTEPSGDGSDEDPSNVNPVQKDIPIIKIVVGIIGILFYLTICCIVLKTRRNVANTLRNN